jgi:hypothetical protein
MAGRGFMKGAHPMKKISKKLVLNRETVRNLQDKEFQTVYGGFQTEVSCENSCDTATRWACSRRAC